MKTKEEILKIKAVAVYVVNNFPEGVDYMKFFKILYFAQQEYLASYGQSLIEDTFRALKYGPVPSFIYRCTKTLDGKLTETKDIKLFTSGFLTKGHKIYNNTKPILDTLTSKEIKCLDNTLLKYKSSPTFALSNLSHDKAWEEAFQRGKDDPEKDRMSQIEIARAGGATEEIIAIIRGKQLQRSNQINIDLDTTKDQWFSRLDQLSQLPQNWDSEGACPILKEIIDFTHQLIQNLDSATLEKWWLVPAPNGTLGLIARKKIRASISIGTNGFSYLAKNNEKDKIKGHGNLNFNEIKEKVEQITDRFLQ